MTEQQQWSGTEPMEEQVREMLVEGAGVEVADLTADPDSSLVDLGVDSLAAMELQALVQSRHGVRIPDEAPQMSVPEIAKYIESSMEVE